MNPIRTARLTVLLLASATGLIAAASPAWATYDGPQPTFASHDVYFHCYGSTRVSTLNYFVDGGFAPWDANPPAQSVQDGAGCSGVDNGWTSNEIYDVVFEGTFTGNLRDLTVRLHEFLVNNTRQGAAQRMRVYAEVDGEPVFPGATPSAGYTGRTFTLTPVSENSGATALFEFSITNLGFATPVYDSSGALVDVQHGGVALEDGAGTQEHTLRLFVGIDSFFGEQQPIANDVFVWDTSEVPSGITFNPPELAAAKVQADLPNLSG